MKRCSACRKVLPFTDFSKSTTKDGYGNQCKKCRHDGYIKHRKNILTKNKIYREKNKEKIAILKQEWYQKNRKKVIQRVSRYYIKNKEKILRYHKMPETMERQRINRKKQRDNNREHFLQREREWQKTPEGKAAKKRGNAKRRRNLKFIPLFLNPFPDEIKVDYHHINNLLVIPLPTVSHNLVLGKHHKRKCNQLIKRLYGLNLQSIIE